MCLNKISLKYEKVNINIGPYNVQTVLSGLLKMEEKPK